MPQDKAFAHSCAEVPPGPAWHRLEDHLLGTAARAGAFAADWQGADFAYLAGLWHDLGKYAPDWQSYLCSAGQDPHVHRRGPDHSSAGAVHASKLGAVGLPIQFAIAGHHAGLADFQALRSRLAEKQARYESAVGEASPSVLVDAPRPTYPAFLHPGDSASRNRALETFARMVFSALVDADFLDTEAFHESGKPDNQRKARSGWAPLEAYADTLDAHLNQLASTTPNTPVNHWRQRVLSWCRQVSRQSPGVFSLTVPTGGGKTLSSLAFGLRHALAHGMERVIIALPFTSILDQTATTLKEIFEPAFGEHVLVEHHSAIDPILETPLNRLASENWDAPLVVTTQVQLFESLFANRTSRCRKLHNVAGAVLILDEVQTLPAPLLAPILDQLQQLAANYRTSVLLTTATQPSLHTRALGARRFTGFDPPPREIVPEESTPELFSSLRRVRIHWPEGDNPVTWLELAEKALAHRQVMLIVHRRADAADLWGALRERGDPDAVHLSALMCPAHRKETLAAIRQALQADTPCRVVSTQLVEAGVDLDFPVVYRAMAGLESLAQAAGRCNREGRLEAGDFHVFNAPTLPPMLLRHHQEIAEVMLELDHNLDLMEPATFRAYFDRLYADGTDARAIQPLREGLRFEETATRFRVIDDATEQVIVPFGPLGRRAIERFRHAGPGRETLRALQPYSVSVYPRSLEALRGQGDVELLHDMVHVLRTPDLYDSSLGLNVRVRDQGPLIA